MTELRISELASSTGVPPTTLRYYEQVGLLPADRTPNGYRIYDQQAIERLRFISAAKRLDLSLDSIRELLGAWEDEACRSVKARLRPMITTRLAETDNGVAALTELAAVLHQGLQRLDALPDRDHACDPTCAFLSDPAAAIDSPSQLAAASPAETAQPEPALIACTLSGHDQEDRIERWHELLHGAQVHPTPTGAAIDIPVGSIAELAALISAEQQCCPFFRFELTFHGPTARLTISADDPALVAELLPDQQRS